jgi:hypothetical protein
MDIPGNPLVNFRTLAIGSVFHLDAYYGNVYQKCGPGQAQLIRHRSNPEYVGIVLRDFGTDRGVRRQPLTPDEIELLGIDPSANPFLGVYTPPPEWDLLGEAPKPKTVHAYDLLGDYSPEPYERTVARSKRRRKQELDLL